MTKKKQRAVGHVGFTGLLNMHQVDAVLEEKHKIDRLGYGRVITTVGSLPEITAKLDDGWEILWCQLSKQTHGYTGEDDHD